MNYLKWVAKPGSIKTIEYFQDPSNVKSYKMYKRIFQSIGKQENIAWVGNIKSIKKVVRFYIDKIVTMFRVLCFL